MCDGFGIAPDTFLNCLCVQPRFIEIYGSSGSVGTFVEGAALQEIYSILATIRGWVGTRYILLTQAFTKITYSGVHGALSISQRLLWQARTPHRSINPVMASVWVFAEPPAGSSGQDALGLITLYPRPDELRSSLLLPITHHSQPPSIPPFFQGFDPASTAAFPIQEHLTIRCGGCQHNHKINRITVYPFMLLKGTNG